MNNHNRTGNGFLYGMAKTLDLGAGMYQRPRLSVKVKFGDIADDWEAVGKDMEFAIKQNGERKEGL
jgi:hypothetical protein